MKNKKMAAFDFGATSCRGILGEFDGEHLSISEFLRFITPTLWIRDQMFIDILAIYAHLCGSIASLSGGVESLGICSWSGDFALLDRHDLLISNPFFYRGGLTMKYYNEMLSKIPRSELFDRTGTQVNLIGF
jgi:sugar (pentulose or hexulose) kinase